MSQAPEKSDPRQEPIYRAILAVLIASVLVGAALTVGGEALFGSAALANAGFGMAVVCGGLYWVFRILGKRASARVGRRAAQRVADKHRED
jgi:high-affinity Fe2+/Pb2+ permease